MRDYLIEFMNDFDYPIMVREVLISAFDRTYARAECFELFEKIRSLYEKDSSMDFSCVLNLAKDVSVHSGVAEYTTHLLTLILLTKTSVLHYEKAGIDRDIWKANFYDLKYKAEECFLVKGVHGVFCPEWYNRFFAVRIFSLGRMQFEPAVLGREYEKNGTKLVADDFVIKCHIPRSGIRLTPQTVEDAVERASAFFKEKYKIEKVVFVCHSWLLYPENKNVLSPTSNLYSFIDRFDIIEVEDDYEYRDAWRLFDKDYNGNVDDLPKDSSFRRAYVERIRNKLPLGEGYGVWVYEK